MPDSGTRVSRVRARLALTAVALIVLPFGFVLLQVLTDGPLVSLDHRTAAAVNRFDLGNPNLVASAQLVTQFGSTPALLMIVIVAAVFLAAFKGRRRDAAFLVTATVVGTVVNNIVKFAVGRDRPHFSPAAAAAFGKSFPSGHAMNSTVVYGALLVVVWPTLRDVQRMLLSGVVVIALAAIGASRVVLNVHYVSDVIAGVSLGAALVCASVAAFMSATRPKPAVGQGTITCVAKRSLP